MSGQVGRCSGAQSRASGKYVVVRRCEGEYSSTTRSQCPKPLSNLRKRQLCPSTAPPEKQETVDYGGWPIGIHTFRDQLGLVLSSKSKIADRYATGTVPRLGVAVGDFRFRQWRGL